MMVTAGARKITAIEDIRFVGSLYEEANNHARAVMFFSGARASAQITDGQVFYYLTDHLGGTNVLMDSQGVKQILEYLPYGKITARRKVRHDRRAGCLVPFHRSI